MGRSCWWSTASSTPSPSERSLPSPQIGPGREEEDIREIDAELRQVHTQLETLVEGSGTTLTGIVGISTIVAARLIGEIGDPRRFPTSSAFATGNGTAPLDTSSGRHERHRLNRGGNRRVNRALYTIAITQTRHEPRAVDYLARKPP